MTKAVRIENADTSNYRVIVETWDRAPEGQLDRLAKTTELSYPTMISTEGITSTRYLVVKEAPPKTMTEAIAERIS